MYLKSTCIVFNVYGFGVTFYIHLFSCSAYDGEVLNGKRHGIGTFKCKNNKLSYSGEWSLGKRHGKVSVQLQIIPFNRFKIIIIDVSICIDIYVILMFLKDYKKDVMMLILEQISTARTLNKLPFNCTSR